MVRLKIIFITFFLLLPQLATAQTREKVRVALGSISVNTSVIPVGHQYVPYASVAGVKAVLQFLAAGQPKAATANPEDFYDMSILKKIEDSGFAKTLVGKTQ